MRLITEKIELKSPYRDYYTGSIIKTSSKTKMFDHYADAGLESVNDRLSERKNIRFIIR